MTKRSSSGGRESERWDGGKGDGRGGRERERERGTLYTLLEKCLYDLKLWSEIIRIGYYLEENTLADA